MSLKTKLRLIKSEFSTIYNYPDFYKKDYFSQEGEDIILKKIFINKPRGFYVDIGAHHPFRYSNTYLLYKKGWKGINIDPSPNVKKLFDRTRVRDVNLGIAINNKSLDKDFYIFEDSALNTISKKIADEVIKSKQSRLIKKIKVKTQKLDNVFKKYLGRKNIDLLNIDAEGLDKEILLSINWAKYRPKVIAIENISRDKKVSKYLNNLGYALYAQTHSTQIYIDEKK